MIDNFKKYKNTILIISVIIIVLAVNIFLRKEIKEGRYFHESPYCQTDSECQLYNCSNCGNIFWISQNVEERNPDCSNPVPGLVGCECIEGQCKRKYER